MQPAIPGSEPHIECHNGQFFTKQETTSETRLAVVMLRYRPNGELLVTAHVFNEIASDNTLPVASGSITDQDEFDRFYIKTTNPYINGQMERFLFGHCPF